MLPVYDKPMVYYPLGVLMLAGIRDILIISPPTHLSGFEHALSDGGEFGISLSYAALAGPNGVAEAFVIGPDFLGDDSVALILGHNIFYGSGLIDLLGRAAKQESGATLYACSLANAERSGVASAASGGPRAPVRPITPVNLPASRPRTGKSVLDGRKMRDMFGIAPPDWKSSAEPVVRPLLGGQR